MQPFAQPLNWLSWATDKMAAVVAELVSFLQAVNSGSLIAYLIPVAFVLIGSASVTVALVYRRNLSERCQIASNATQENFKVIAAELRKRALEMKERDDELRKRDTRERPQQQALKEQQRILRQSVSHAITLGLKGDQNRLLEIDLKGMLSAFQGKRNKAA